MVNSIAFAWLASFCYVMYRIMRKRIRDRREAANRPQIEKLRLAPVICIECRAPHQFKRTSGGL
jgi:hypothetical protein